MLIGIPEIISPDLLAILSKMWHGDEIVLADANFPGERLNPNIVRCDGSEIIDLLKAILQVFPLDKSSKSPWVIMKASNSLHYDTSIEDEYFALLKKYAPDIEEAEKLERFDFYDRASKAYVVVMTRTKRRFGNIVIKKGTIF